MLTRMKRISRAHKVISSTPYKHRRARVQNAPFRVQAKFTVWALALWPTRLLASAGGPYSGQTTVQGRGADGLLRLVSPYPTLAQTGTTSPITKWCQGPTPRINKNLTKTKSYKVRVTPYNGARTKPNSIPQGTGRLTFAEGRH